MSTRAWFVFPTLCMIAFLAGCGSEPEPAAPAAPEGPKLVIPPPSDPEPIEFKQPGKGLGLSKDQVMKGITEISVEDADLPSPDGNTFMGHSADFATDKEHAANLLVYGSPGEIRRIYYTAPANFDGKPDMPEYMKRNLHIAEELLDNVFGTPLPDDVKAGLDFMKTTPDRKKWAKAGSKVVLFTYSSSAKTILLDIK